MGSKLGKASEEAERWGKWLRQSRKKMVTGGLGWLKWNRWEWSDLGYGFMVPKGCAHFFFLFFFFFFSFCMWKIRKDKDLPGLRNQETGEWARLFLKGGRWKKAWRGRGQESVSDSVQLETFSASKGGHGQTDYARSEMSACITGERVLWTKDLEILG